MSKTVKVAEQCINFSAVAVRSTTSSLEGISPGGLYRYLLPRRARWGERAAVFTMLNPSTPDAERDDPTIRRLGVCLRISF